MTDRQFPVHRFSDAALDELTDLLADLAAEDLLRKAAAASPATAEPKRGAAGNRAKAPSDLPPPHSC